MSGYAGTVSTACKLHHHRTKWWTLPSSYNCWKKYLRVSDLNEGAEGYLVVILNNTNLITCSFTLHRGPCNQDMSKHFQISVHKPQLRRARCWMHRGIPWNGSQLGNLRGWVMHKPSSSPCKLAPRRNLVTCVGSEGPPDCKCSRKDTKHH
jgi:hypothetical protein